MKLFIATNEGTIKTENARMLYATLNSAIKNTNFEIFLIFDGDKKNLKLPKKVNVIEHRHRCYDIFLNSKKVPNELYMNIASGAFLRTEIPHICKNLSLNDEYCLYTDYDVLFVSNDYSSLDTIKPEFFAACPELNKNDWSYINSGVMLMNVKNFIKYDDFILNYIKSNFDSFSIWDQTMYNNLYKDKFERLPIEYNWKTYWGKNEQAKIVHFHGAKPKSVEPEWRYNLPKIKSLREKNEEGYEYYNSLFEQYS